jgi:hypothetical protein
MQTVYLIRATNDGGASDTIAAQLTKSTVTFTALTYGENDLPWTAISSVPCVVIDLDGDIAAVFENRKDRPYDNTALLAALQGLPKESPLPLADIVITDNGKPSSTFAVDAPITITVSIRDPLTKDTVKAFAGQFIVDIQGPTGAIPVGFEFVDGVSTRTLTMPSPGRFAILPTASSLARIPQTSITVYL